ncbi:HAMP domain-containing sensor histidine kinase [Eubacteriaceae bacterium ES2]|nr:HAMP domain-containing sensor histidine kinase [Eubacteriaceae bacterium ES2]
MSRLSIRLKITLWYSLMNVFLLAVFLPVLYVLISNSIITNEKGILRNAASQVILGCEIENDRVVWSEETKLPDDANVAIVDINGNFLVNNSKLDSITTDPFRAGEFQTITKQGSSWLVYDESLKNDNSILAYVRVYSSFNSVNSFLTKVKIIMMIAAPVYLLIATAGGLFIAHKALKPITKITRTAAEIEKGDLSLRIKGINTEDEVGHLADTFNGMLEHLETAFKREKQFSSDASHELRTPVSIIIAYSEALIASQNKITSEEKQNYFELIHSEGRKMKVIISQLLMLTRGYEGKYQLEIETIDLNEIITNVIEQLLETASESIIELQYDSNEEIMCRGDQSLITQMLFNLIENGIKYGKPGGYVRVSASIEKNSTQITITDNGMGISQEDLPYIFDRFYRADKSRDRSGTGLGLSIVKWIVEEHNGKIQMNSVPGEGTIFFIVI